ncbi:TOX high mobility group box family member 4-like [Dermacentor variabilis]|uniref:TOX high mobility group box family member 4-like n=1 Tax=Dermacentor variabilis TaxID=34621 RepID=UPI003F5BE681
MYSPGLGPTHQRGRRAFYPATFRNMAPYENAYLDHDMCYPILPPPSQDPFGDSPNMLSGMVPLSDTVSDGSSPVSNHTSSANGCNGEDSDDNGPFAKLLNNAEILADDDDDEGSADEERTVHKQVECDPEEPQRPMSAYAQFFCETQAAIKVQNPHASFGEVSQIVASMWEGLEAEQKLAYKRKTKAAKKEYRRVLTEHRSPLAANGAADQLDIDRRSGYVSSPSAMRTPPRGSMSPLQNNNPLLSSVMDEGSPRNYMVAASPEDVLRTRQQQQQHPMALSSPSMFQKPKQASVMPRHCSPKVVMNSASPSSASCATALKPQRSPSLCYQTSGRGVGVPNNHGPMPVGHIFARCRRNGCPNPPVASHEWDVEYCSSECVILYCKNVFSAWAAQRQIAERSLPH